MRWTIKLSEVIHNITKNKITESQDRSRIYITKTSFLVCLSVLNKSDAMEVKFGNKIKTVQCRMLKNLNEKITNCKNSNLPNF